MDENKSGLKKDIVRMICISIILCGLLVLCYFWEKPILTITLLHSLFIYIQICMCFKLKNAFVKLIPAILFLVLCFTFRSIASSTSGYESLAYTINAILTATLFVSCMFAWVICLIANGGKNKKKERKA